MISSDAVRLNDKRFRSYHIPDAWIGAMMGANHLVPPHGLYFRADPDGATGFVTPFIGDYGIRPLWDHRTAMIVGVELRLLVKDYVLWLDEEGRGPRPDLGYLEYRCPTVYCKRDGLLGLVDFAWEIGGTGAIEVVYSAEVPPAGHEVNKRWHHYGETFEGTARRYKELMETDE